MHNCPLYTMEMTRKESEKQNMAAPPRPGDDLCIKDLEGQQQLSVDTRNSNLPISGQRQPSPCMMTPPNTTSLPYKQPQPVMKNSPSPVFPKLPKHSQHKFNSMPDLMRDGNEHSTSINTKGNTSSVGSSGGVGGAFSWINSKFTNLSALLSISKRDSATSKTSTSPAEVARKKMSVFHAKRDNASVNTASSGIPIPTAPHLQESHETCPRDPSESMIPVTPDLTSTVESRFKSPRTLNTSTSFYSTPECHQTPLSNPPLFYAKSKSQFSVSSATDTTMTEKPTGSVADSAVILDSTASMEGIQKNSRNASSSELVEKISVNPCSSDTAPCSDTVKPTANDEESNKRHSMVVSLLSGERGLSDEFFRKYKIGDLLGDGAFGFVMTASRLADGKEVAVKFIIREKIPKDSWIDYAPSSNDTTKRKRIPIEIYILSKLNHPNIIQYLEHFEEEDYILLITELHGTEWNVKNPLLTPATNPGLRQTGLVKATPNTSSAAAAKSGTASIIECSPLFRLTPEQEKSIRRRTSCDLFECIDCHVRMPEATIRRIFAQIVLAVYALHCKGIVHRDLKDENIVVDERYRIKLIDFGSAARIPADRNDYFTKFNGTAHFASPEIAHGRAYRGPEAEMWALGVLLYTIVFGENPYQTRADILKGVYTFPFKVSYLLENLIVRLLEYDERKRMTIKQAINHEWLASEIRLLQHAYQQHSSSDNKN